MTTVKTFYFKKGKIIVKINWIFPGTEVANLTEVANFEMFYTDVTVDTYMGLTITSVVVAFVAFLLLAHLALFHIYINYIGITTYEYVRAARIAQDQQDLNSASGNGRSSHQQSHKESQEAASRQVQQNNATAGEEEAITEHQKCCQFCSCWTKKRKVVPAGSEENGRSKGEPYIISGQNQNGTSSNYSSQVTKLPPIHTERPVVHTTSRSKVKKVEVEARPEEPSSSSASQPSSLVPKLPKLTDNASKNNFHKTDGQNNGQAVADQLAKVQRHLESVEIENQDKIFVVEV